MAPTLSLMCQPGSAGPSDVVEAARRLLVDVRDPVVGYLPAASVSEEYLDINEAAFAGVAALSLLSIPRMAPDVLRLRLKRADLLYVPGGNTFLLASRIRQAGLWQPIRDALANGLPYIGFSAGAVLCGPDILNSNDVNASGLRSFGGLRLVPWSINVHYPSDAVGRHEREERIQPYLELRRRPVLALEDDAEVMVAGQDATLVRGTAWIHRRGDPPTRLGRGPIPTS